MSDGRPFFIVGSPRSGTGLLRDLVRAHPAIEIPSESHFIPVLFRGYCDPLSGRTASTLARRILALASAGARLEYRSPSGAIEIWKLHADRG